MDDLLNDVEVFLNSNKAVDKAFSYFKSGAEIELRVGQKNYFTIIKQNTKVEVLRKQSENKQVAFQFNAEATRHLLQQSNLNVGDFGVEVLKQYSLGNVQIKLHCSLIKLIRQGYFNLMREAGAPFWNHLSQFGIKNMNRLSELIGNLRTSK
ncbi:MAG: hypothetical protein AB8E15_05645 [Bdellovibrionales bacterium]